MIPRTLYPRRFLHVIIHLPYTVILYPYLFPLLVKCGKAWLWCDMFSLCVWYVNSVSHHPDNIASRSWPCFLALRGGGGWTGGSGKCSGSGGNQACFLANWLFGNFFISIFSFLRNMVLVRVNGMKILCFFSYYVNVGNFSFTDSFRCYLYFLVLFAIFGKFLWHWLELCILFHCWCVGCWVRRLLQTLLVESQLYALWIMVLFSGLVLDCVTLAVRSWYGDWSYPNRSLSVGYQPSAFKCIFIPSFRILVFRDESESTEFLSQTNLAIFYYII